MEDILTTKAPGKVVSNSQGVPQEKQKGSPIKRPLVKEMSLAVDGFKVMISPEDLKRLSGNM